MKCPECGAEFEPKVHNQKYYGAECLKRKHRKEQARYIEKKGGNEYRRAQYQLNREKLCLQQKVRWIKAGLRKSP